MIAGESCMADVERALMGEVAPLCVSVDNFSGVQQAVISYEVDDQKRIDRIAKIVDGMISPIPGHARGEDSLISVPEHSIAPDITVAKSEHMTMCACGRNRNFAGRALAA